MQRLEVSGAVGLLYGSLGVKGLKVMKISAPRGRPSLAQTRTRLHGAKVLQKFRSKITSQTKIQQSLRMSLYCIRHKNPLKGSRELSFVCPRDVHAMRVAMATGYTVN
jgi:hypothetical protein